MKFTYIKRLYTNTANSRIVFKCLIVENLTQPYKNVIYQSINQANDHSAANSRPCVRSQIDCAMQTILFNSVN